MPSPGPCLEAINLHDLQFTADELRSLNELVVTAVLESPDLATFHTLVTGIKNDKEIGILPGTFGLVGLPSQGCNPVAQCFQAIAVAKKWSPKRIEIIIDQCVTDVYDSLVRLALNCGIDIFNLTTTEYFPFILNILAKDIQKMLFRMAWFGDTAADNVSNGGHITNGVPITYFNSFDGFFVQMADIVTGDATKRTILSQGNDQLTHALQNTVYTPAFAYADLNRVIDDSISELAMAPDRVLLVTRSVAQRALRHLQSLGVAYKTELMLNGMESSVWDGIQMYTIPLWDQMIRAYEDDGARANDPHRIVLTTKSNLNIGMECTSLFTNINTFYDPTTRLNRIEASDAFDAKIIDDRLFQIGV